MPANPLNDPRPVLTLRQRQCLIRAARGMQQKRIAKDLGLSHPTVRIHSFMAVRGLGCHSMPHAVARALRLGLVTLEEIGDPEVGIEPQFREQCA